MTIEKRQLSEQNDKFYHVTHCRLLLQRTDAK